MPSQRTVVVIPARKGSTRFPNKPMAPVAGIPLLRRTWRIARAVQGVDEVIVATDDADIRAFAEGFGARVVMTRPECENGTVRVFEAIRGLPERPAIAVNLQGDAVLTPPWVVQAAVDEIQGDAQVLLATPATQLDWERYDEFLASKAGGRAGGTTVVFGRDRDALYFSKGTVPFLRERRGERSPVYRHIGLYCYRYAALEKYCGLEPTPLEEAEKLEQLRALENGIPIRVVPVDYRGRTHWSIDNPEDVAIAEEIIAREGELVA